jgi:hypothetical protein
MVGLPVRAENDKDILQAELLPLLTARVQLADVGLAEE